MSGQSLAAALESAGGAVPLLRDLGKGRFTALPDEYTHWISEQRSWRESCALFDLSYHMSDLELSGPGALSVYRDLAINDFSGFDVGDAKQLVVANPDGYLIGDAILVRLGEESFLSVGPEAPHNWLHYHVETGDYDASSTVRGRAVATKQDPKYYRFQVQGPNAIEVVAAATDGSAPEIPFFDFDGISIDGHEAHALRHGMAGEPGFEIWGPYAQGEAVKEALLDAGEAHGIRRVGSRAYQTTPLVSGWLPLPVPAIYDHEGMADYREWLDARRGMISIGGSLDSTDITDYYLTPVEVGYGKLADLGRDFVGREAIAAELEDPGRTKVTLVWDPDDVVSVFGSLFREGEPGKFMDLPVPRSAACNYDAVEKEGEQVGVGKWRGYVYPERAMLSLAVVDLEHAEPGTELTLRWGEATDGNPIVERHTLTDVRVTVAPAPYVEDRR